MADAKHAPLSTLWHPSHTVQGRIVNGAAGPIGREECVYCHASRRANWSAFNAECGGSVDYDTRIQRACPGAPAAIAKATRTGGPHA